MIRSQVDEPCGIRSQRERAAGNAVGGFTLLELMTAIVIVLILAVMLLETNSSWRVRADQSRCMTNLKSLYLGALAYVQEQEHWPQINGSLAGTSGTQYATEWYAALAPYGVARKIWVCPSIQHDLGDPDLEKAENARVDYIATPFDNLPRTPFKWSTQPWFIEKGSSHPGGNQMVFEDGQIMNMVQAAHRTYQAP